ncbi:uroporphyrinogen-III synthase [Staphylococcus simulans]|uniref:uroporphyrinogen-III synthase n=1 Tax=Staphylococcus simulans TaxID=1286 RepID=UPI000D1DBC8E|nr:uroporphyrinogen-III synthase [Staphylococcus simulans]PTJ92180.1 uroporphyrinogen III synthase [Staphylococcus simulans]
MSASVIMTQSSSMPTEDQRWIHLPFIKLEPLAFDDSVLNRSYTWLVFSSKNAVRYFLPYLSLLRYEKVAVIGEKTQRFCEQHGIEVDFCPEDFSQEGFLDKFTFKEGASIFIPSSKAARPILEEVLKERGADVVKIDLYEPVENQQNILYAIKLLKEQSADGIAFASSSSAENFFKALKRCQVQPDFECYAIGQPTYETVRKNGYDAIIARKQTIDGLIYTIKESRNLK